MKRLLLFVVMSFLLSSGAMARIYFVAIDGIGYSLDSDNMTASVSYETVYRYTNEPKYIQVSYKDHVVIPESVKVGKNTIFYDFGDYVPAGTYKVTTIGRQAFRECTNLKTVSLPNSITTIENSAFYKCDNLESVDIPNSVKSIGWYAFELCSRLKTIELPNDITTIEGGCFRSCTNLETVILPSSLGKVGQALFMGCSNLHSVTIPEGVKIIEGAAFADCPNLQSIIIPNSIDSIGYSAFAHTGLKQIEIPSNVILAPLVFSGCENLESAVLLDNVKLYNDCFITCRKFKKVKLGEYAQIESRAFMCCLIDSINIPKGSVIRGYGSFYGCVNLEYLSIEEDVQLLSTMTFADCIKLRNVYVQSEIPMEGNDDLFRSDNYLKPYGLVIEDENCIYEQAELHVPVFRGFDYRLVSPWKNFRTVTDDIGKVPHDGDDDKYKLGDANNDGEIDSKDIDAITDYILAGKADNFIFKNADVNGDKNVNAADIVLIVKMIK